MRNSKTLLPMRQDAYWEEMDDASDNLRIGLILLGVLAVAIGISLWCGSLVWSVFAAGAIPLFFWVCVSYLKSNWNGMRLAIAWATLSSMYILWQCIQLPITVDNVMKVYCDVYNLLIGFTLIALVWNGIAWCKTRFSKRESLMLSI